MSCFTEADTVSATFINFENAFSSMESDQLMIVKRDIIDIDKILVQWTQSSSIQLLKELNFSMFISSDCEDKRERLEFICDILQFSDFCSTLNPITSINLSLNHFNNNDLHHIIQAIQNNEKCRPHFDNIQSINLGFNLFDDENIIHQFFNLLRTKFPNLVSLNLEQNGILCSLYHEHKSSSFELPLTTFITWFSTPTDENEDESIFSFQSDSEDDDSDDDDNNEDDSNQDESHSFHHSETVANLFDEEEDDDDDDRSTLCYHDNDVHELQIAYSVVP